MAEAGKISVYLRSRPTFLRLRNHAGEFGIPMMDAVEQAVIHWAKLVPVIPLSDGRRDIKAMEQLLQRTRTLVRAPGKRAKAARRRKATTKSSRTDSELK